MSKSKLYGLKRPERTAEVKLEEADRGELIRTTYEMWLDFAEPYWNDGYMIDNDVLYRHACKILAPLRKSISGTLTEKDFRIVDEKPAPRLNLAKGTETTNLAGLYMTAVLNATDAKELVLGHFNERIAYPGYHLQAGKTLTIAEKGFTYDAGYEAEGGTLINKGKNTATFGTFAQSCTLINYGESEGFGMGRFARSCNLLNDGDAWGFGSESERCIGINRGHSVVLGAQSKEGIFVNCDDSNKILGCGSKRSTLINYGKINVMGEDDEDSVFVSMKHAKEVLKKAKAPNRYVSPTEILSDARLKDLLMDLEDVVKVKGVPDFQKTAVLGRQIDAHVRKKYEPRTVI